MSRTLVKRVLVQNIKTRRRKRPARDLGTVGAFGLGVASSFAASLIHDAYKERKMKSQRDDVKHDTRPIVKIYVGKKNRTTWQVISMVYAYNSPNYSKEFTSKRDALWYAEHTAKELRKNGFRVEVKELKR